MTMNEFISWFDGYVEAIENRPSIDQWRVIREKLSSVQESDIYLDSHGVTRRKSNIHPLKQYTL